MNLLVSLTYLVALDDHRHFGRAALAAHVTQPALSNAIRALEESFGTAIVKRGRAFEGFTDEGLRVLQTARRVLHEHEMLQQDLRSTQDTPKGHVLIGAVPTAMPIAARFAARLQARHPGIVPRLRSMSSVELETGLENQALDMGLGYAERTDQQGSSLRVVPQYIEHYFLLRRRADRIEKGQPRASGLRIGEPISWADAARLPLCLLSAEMHNRTIVDRAFASAGVQVTPAIETNSILTLVLSVVAGEVCSIMPGALVGTAQGYPGIEAAPLIGPLIEVPIAFLTHDTYRHSRTLESALTFARSPEWLEHAAHHSGPLSFAG